MLTLLQIQNIAVIEYAEITFESGLNVLTGETGAGKSIVIDAISAILGERTYRDLIRTGCDKASVTAVFSGVPELPWFQERQIAYESDELLIQREIFSDGKNLCRVNGKPVTVSILRELGRNLINIHGQHDTQSLFDEQSHLGYLDLLLDESEVLPAYSSAYDAYKSVQQEVDRLTMNESEKIRKMEMLQYQITEIQRAELEPGEDRELESRRLVLQNAERLSDSLSSSVYALCGNENSHGIVSLLDDVQKELHRLSGISETYRKYADVIADLRFTAEDISQELRSELDDLSYSGDELERIENRLDVIHRLRKKYGADVDEILTFAENAQKELDEIEFSESKLEILREKLASAQNSAEEAGRKLRNQRKKTAEQLSKRIVEELDQLDMPNIQFVTEFEETELSVNGLDFVRFLMSANLGEALKPMSKVASGGELARIMLAMKNVLAEKDHVSTLIFDEVDAGVSGRAAQKVAEKLRTVSKGKQVFCVTHLPQIAALADAHLLISKAVHNDRTYTSVTKLDQQGRVEELSRIIGGSQITENTRKSARDMLHSV